MDLAELWRRLTALPATVRARVGDVVFLALPAPWKSASVRRVAGWDPKPGDVLEAAGREDHRLAEAGRRGFRVLGVRLRGEATVLQIGDDAALKQAQAAPASRPAWLEALARHQLLSRSAVWCLGSSSLGLSPVGLLMRKHPASVPSHGFIHYDWRWANDTRDPVRDLAALVERPNAFRLRALEGERLSYEVVGHDELVTVNVAAGALSKLAASMNSWLDELCAARRLFAWDTGMHRLAFLGRSRAEVDALAADVPVGPLTLV